MRALALAIFLGLGLAQVEIPLWHTLGEGGVLEAEAEAFLARCPLIEQATSCGGVHSAAERRSRWGDAVADGFIRLSIGVEPVETLWSAIEGALAG